MVEQDSSWLLFSGSSHEELAKEVAKKLKVKLGLRTIELFPDGEIGMQILENVRGKDVFVLQSIARRPNHYLMELLIMIDALKRASAKSVVVVLPYFGYARQDRKEKGRVPITAKLVANLLEKAGATRVLTMDLHTEQIQGFFDIPVDNLYARPLFVHAIRDEKLSNLVIVSPDMGSNKMARKFAEDLNVEIAIVDKRRFNATKVEASALIGHVSGKNVMLVDDICSTGGTLQVAAAICKKNGAKSVCACVSHGLLINGPLRGAIDRMLITNSVSPSEAAQDPSVTTVSVAGLFAQAIERILTAQSISALFKNEKEKL
jgi:ribose-phosphate pyrophosphokinase